MTAGKKKPGSDTAPAPAKKGPGRPATGQTPVKDRVASSKEALLAAGGRRTSVNLTPEANNAIQVLKDRHQLRTDTDVINAALIRDLKSSK